MKLPIGKLSWCLLDCVSGEAISTTSLPYEIGSGDAVDLRLPPDEVCERHCAIVKSGKKHWLVKRNPEAIVMLDGVPFDHAAELDLRTDYSLRMGNRLYLLRGDPKMMDWLKRLRINEWILQDTNSGQTWGPVPLDALRTQIDQIGVDPSGFVTALTGAEKGFYFEEISYLLPEPAVEVVAAEETEAAPVDAGQDFAAPDIDEISGEFTCPTCWKHFDRKDLLWIARHPSLRGTDPDLGEDVMLRFKGTDYDELGHARDPMGISCGEQACPHCKRRLHPGFLDLENHIFSIVGAPSAGKSYYLTSAIKRLEEALPKRFGVAFQDADAEGNAIVSVMKARLFSSASKPEDLHLIKTQQSGEMFEMWERDGRKMRLPKPFTYLVSPFDRPDDHEEIEPVNLIFYDNAGEQFEPAEKREEDQMESTQHLASSSMIFFLFDPTSNSEFRSQLHGNEDPQINDPRFAKLDRQNSILSEMRNRIKRELNIGARDRIDTPIAMLVGKCDVWSDLLERGPNPFHEPIGEGRLELEAIEKNSKMIREFLMDITPNIVANAEAISSEVVYFPTSPLGHSPQPFTRNDIVEIGPVPGMVNPIHTEIPIVWALSKLNPQLIPSAGPEPDAKDEKAEAAGSSDDEKEASPDSDPEPEAAPDSGLKSENPPAPEEKPENKEPDVEPAPPEPEASYEEADALKLVEALASRVEISSPGTFSFARNEATEGLAEDIGNLHRKHPDVPELHYAHAAALQLNLLGKSADEVLERCAEAHPSFWIGKLTDERHSIFSWNPLTCPGFDSAEGEPVHSSIEDILTRALLLPTRRGMIPRAVLFQRDDDFDVSALRDCRIECMMTVSPVDDPQVIAINVCIWDDPDNPYRTEVLACPFQGVESETRFTYELFARQGNFDFVIVDGSGRVKFSRTLTPSTKMKETMERLAEMFDSSEGSEISNPDMVAALQRHTSMINPESIAFQ